MSKARRTSRVMADSRSNSPVVLSEQAAQPADMAVLKPSQQGNRSRSPLVIKKELPAQDEIQQVKKEISVDENDNENNNKYENNSQEKQAMKATDDENVKIETDDSSSTKSVPSENGTNNDEQASTPVTDSEQVKIKVEAESSLQEEHKPLITESMLEEEKKLHEVTIKEEERQKKDYEMELHKMDEDMREQRYKGLQFLLTKSKLYTHYLVKRMQKQKEEEEEKQKQKEARALKKAEKEAAQTTAQSEDSSEDKSTNTLQVPSQMKVETSPAKSDASGPARRGSPRRSPNKAETLEVPSGQDSRDVSPAKSDSSSSRRRSPRRSPNKTTTSVTTASASPGGRATRSGAVPTAKVKTADKPVKSRGKKRKAEDMKITDMFAEVLARNKRQKAQNGDAVDSQESEASETSQDDQNKEVEGETNQPKKEPNAEVEDDEPTDHVFGKGKTLNGEDVLPEQPILFNGGVLRQYQVDGYKWLKVLYENGVNGILADEMGLGKTIQCIAVIAHLVYQGLAGPFLVVGPLSTVPNWVAEFEKFAPKIPVILYHGSQEARTLLRRDMMKQHRIREGVMVQPVVITSYEIAMNDRKHIGSHHWKYLIVDEGHRIKNFQCKLIKELKCYNTTHRLLLTGTPLQNDLSELWSLLNFLLPEIFDDLGSFQSWFDIDYLKTDMSNEAIVKEEQKNSILTMLHEILSPFMLRRIKADVCLNIPPKREVLVYAPLSIKQREQYRSIVDRTLKKLIEGDEEKEMAAIPLDKHGRGIRKRKSVLSAEQQKALLDLENNEINEESEDDSDIEEWFSSVGDCNNNETPCTQIEPQKARLNIQFRNIMFMLKNCCNHPYLIEYPLDGSGLYRVDHDILPASGKLMLLDKMLTKLKKDGHKVLIFSQMTRILDILEDYCYLKEYTICRLDGGVKMDDRRKSIRDFNSQDSEHFIFLLSTRAGGLGINLTAADTCIIFDSDWNPQCDLQAQDRCHRIGQTRPVMIYRLITANTIDQQIVERAAAKRKLEKMVITKGKFTSGGYWSKELEAIKDLPDKIVPTKPVKPMSALSPSELLALLRSTDFDSEHTVTEEEQVISDKDLDKLLDRSDLWKIMEERKSGDKQSKVPKKPKAATKDEYKDVKGVFTIVAEDMGANIFGCNRS